MISMRKLPPSVTLLRVWIHYSNTLLIIGVYITLNNTINIDFQNEYIIGLTIIFV